MTFTKNYQFCDHPLSTKMNNRSIVKKQFNPQTRDKFQDPPPLLCGRQNVWSLTENNYFLRLIKKKSCCTQHCIFQSVFALSMRSI